MAVITILIVGGSWLLNYEFNPFLFLILLHLITMRSRLIVDIAHLLVRRGDYALAFRLYQIGLVARAVGPVYY